MTHVVWAPPAWLPAARKVLQGLHERHPARTILLVPEPGRRDGVEATASVREFELHDLQREVLSEVIEVRLRGRPAAHPASIVLPLLLSDLPAFCRWRGEPRWSASAFGEILDVVDRLVVDSAEWRVAGPRLRAARAGLRSRGGVRPRVLAGRCRGACDWPSAGPGSARSARCT